MRLLPTIIWTIGDKRCNGRTGCTNGVRPLIGVMLSVPTYWLEARDGKCQDEKQRYGWQGNSLANHDAPPNSSSCARARSRSICSGVAPSASRMSSMKARATSPSPE